MNTLIFPEDVANVVQAFCMENEGDEAATDLILAIGAQLLDVSIDRMMELVNIGGQHV